MASGVDAAKLHRYPHYKTALAAALPLPPFFLLLGLPS